MFYKLKKPLDYHHQHYQKKHKRRTSCTTHLNRAPDNTIQHLATQDNTVLPELPDSEPKERRKDLQCHGHIRYDFNLLSIFTRGIYFQIKIKVSEF